MSKNKEELLGEKVKHHLSRSTQHYKEGDYDGAVDSLDVAFKLARELPQKSMNRYLDLIEGKIGELANKLVQEGEKRKTKGSQSEALGKYEWILSSLSEEIEQMRLKSGGKNIKAKIGLNIQPLEDLESKKLEVLVKMVAILGTILGLFILSFNITGNVIGKTQSFKTTGAILLALGVIAIHFLVSRRRQLTPK